ncbi:hypothetical protein BDR04DRAFT_1146156 [Suillus decipiens]|nr:hypothetical protein BDR04DRAFT_1146156 [Suillus decipiens]
MRFSSEIVLVIVAALASSISATPTDASAGDCPVFCWIDINCQECTWGLCKFPFCTSRQENIGIVFVWLGNVKYDTISTHCIQDGERYRVSRKAPRGHRHEHLNLLGQLVAALWSTLD